MASSNDGSWTDPNTRQEWKVACFEFENGQTPIKKRKNSQRGWK